MLESIAMPKLFANFPFGFEQYNPEIIIFDEDNLVTVDDEGRHHSYDDKPAVTVKHPKGLIELWWYSHGVLYRENGKPLHVMYGPALYATYTADGMMHSYNEQPAAIIIPIPLVTTYKDVVEFSANFEWYRNGTLHRSNDLPAMQVVRDNVIISEIYYIAGLKHRPKENIVYNNFAYSRHNASLTESTCYHCLYGVVFSEEIFDRIMMLKRTENVPLWAAFFFVLDVLSKESFNALKQQYDSWEESVPFTWVMRTLGVTEEIFQTKIRETYKKGYEATFEKANVPEPFLVTLAKIVKSDQKEDFLKETK
jgi:hypothetical protein